ncbi:ABC-type metal ion transport system, periplasmic component/surface adhesin [Burkholderia pseudomallei 305]|nr:ABC-type metal ion transport system, periplasmic component/surface adhesin [Burkholderia pseudomallei 305]
MCAFVVAGRGDRAGVGDGSIVIGRERAYLALATKPTGWRGRRNPQHGEIEALDKEPQGYPDTETPRKIRSNALRRRRSESLRIASPSDAPRTASRRPLRPPDGGRCCDPTARRALRLATRRATFFHAGGGRAAALGRTPTARSLLHSSRNS